MSKNIIICCDGTDNKYGKNNTNVAKLYQNALRNNQQILFYDPGVGTTFTVYNKDRMGSMFGWGLQKNVNDAYLFLMNNFSEGDKIFLFGFSRGAYTVRALSGMLIKYGLLYPHNNNLLKTVAGIYNSKKPESFSDDFKNTFCRTCIPHFIGVWDTVGALGYLYKKTHYFDINNISGIKYCYHAIAIDEKRRQFPISLWTAKKEDDQVLEQVWFTGAHSDIGGGYTESALSNITLKWMLNKAEQATMLLNPDWINHIDLDAPWELHDEMKKIKWKLRKLIFWKGKPYRKIPDGALVHSSVTKHKENKKLKYLPVLPDNFQVIE